MDQAAMASSYERTMSGLLLPFIRTRLKGGENLMDDAVTTKEGRAQYLLL